MTCVSFSSMPFYVSVLLVCFVITCVQVIQILIWLRFVKATVNASIAWWRWSLRLLRIDDSLFECTVFLLNLFNEPEFLNLSKLSSCIVFISPQSSRSSVCYASWCRKLLTRNFIHILSLFSNVLSRANLVQWSHLQFLVPFCRLLKFCFGSLPLFFFTNIKRFLNSFRNSSTFPAPYSLSCI